MSRTDTSKVESSTEEGEYLSTGDHQLVGTDTLMADAQRFVKFLNGTLDDFPED